MLVYRVETKKFGWGPYCYNGYDGPKLRQPKIDTGSRSNRPMAYDDGIGRYPDDHRFGFLSPKLLKKWFLSKDRKELKKSGFVCNVYRVPKKDVVIGRKQLVFDKKKIKFIRKSRAI